MYWHYVCFIPPISSPRTFLIFTANWNLRYLLACDDNKQRFACIVNCSYTFLESKLFCKHELSANNRTPNGTFIGHRETRGLSWWGLKRPRMKVFLLTTWSGKARGLRVLSRVRVIVGWVDWVAEMGADAVGSVEVEGAGVSGSGPGGSRAAVLGQLVIDRAIR